jgi:hypothetical protein
MAGCSGTGSSHSEETGRLGVGESGHAPDSLPGRSAGQRVGEFLRCAAAMSYPCARQTPMGDAGAARHPVHPSMPRSVPCCASPRWSNAPRRVACAAATAQAAASGYARHVPERTLLYALVQAHYPDLLARLAAEDRSLPGYVREEFVVFRSTASASARTPTPASARPPSPSSTCSRPWHSRRPDRPPVVSFLPASGQQDQRLTRLAAELGRQGVSHDTRRVDGRQRHRRDPRVAAAAARKWSRRFPGNGRGPDPAIRGHSSRAPSAATCDLAGKVNLTPFLLDPLPG